MKVLQVCPRYPPQTGGVETHVSRVSEHLADRGHGVTVHTADAGLEGERRERRVGVEVRRHRALAPGGAIHAAPGLATAVRRAGADVVHAHNYHSLPLLFAALGVGDSPFVATPHYHGRSANATRNRLLGLYRPVGERALRRADAVVAVSQWEREQLADDLGIEARVVPNGVDRERLASAPPAAFDRPTLLCVGRLERYKGVQHVVRALPDLEGHDLVVVGDGPYRAELEALARETGVADRVDFAGYVDAERLASLYAGADVLVSLSSFEAYGMAVAEALAAGTPCVVLRERALAEWAEVDGVVDVDATGPEAVRAAVRRAADRSPDPDAVDDWTTVVDRLETAYREVATTP